MISVWWPTRRVHPARPEEPIGFSGSAPHIRGRVTIRGRGGRQPSVVMEVVNTSSGRVLASDNVALHTIYGRGDGLPYIFQACVEATAAARGSWTYEFRQKDLK